MRTSLGAPETSDGGERRRITDSSGEDIGFVECEAHGDVLEVRWIELEPERRGWGHGSEAVRLLEEEAVSRWGVRRVRSDVPVGIGLALYFWLRLGYRPGVPVEDGRDVMMMVREIETG